jgi:hypothetical protein
MAPACGVITRRSGRGRYVARGNGAEVAGEVNVKEHATLSAGASVDHGIDVETTEDHVNRAADRVCCVSTCWPMLFTSTCYPSKGLDIWPNPYWFCLILPYWKSL